MSTPQLQRAFGDQGETHDGSPWRVFSVVAPEGLCYWFGERQAGA